MIMVFFLLKSESQPFWFTSSKVTYICEPALFQFKKTFFLSSLAFCQSCFIWLGLLLVVEQAI